MVSDLNKNFGRSTGLAKKRHGLVDLHTPTGIHPPLCALKSSLIMDHRLKAASRT